MDWPTVKSILEVVALVTVGYGALKNSALLGQRSKKFLDDEARNERVALKVEGDPKELRDHKIRIGIEGRLGELEKTVTEALASPAPADDRGSHTRALPVAIEEPDPWRSPDDTQRGRRRRAR